MNTHRYTHTYKYIYIYSSPTFKIHILIELYFKLFLYTIWSIYASIYLKIENK